MTGVPKQQPLPTAKQPHEWAGARRRVHPPRHGGATRRRRAAPLPRLLQLPRAPSRRLRLAATSAHIALPTTRSGVRGRAKPRRPTTKTAAASRSRRGCGAWQREPSPRRWWGRRVRGRLQHLCLSARTLRLGGGGADQRGLHRSQERGGRHPRLGRGRLPIEPRVRCPPQTCLVVFRFARAHRYSRDSGHRPLLERYSPEGSRGEARSRSAGS